MDSEAKPKKNKKTYHNHCCDRHHDLTILLRAANKKVCNHCFAALKRSYFNLIAGLLLEEHYLHNLTNGLVQQNNILQKQLQDQQQHLLNLAHEITDIKNNGRNHEKPRPKTPSAAPLNSREMVQQQPSSRAQQIYTIGHVAQVARSLQDLLHLQIARIRESWKKKKATTHPKSDDLQEGSTTTHAPRAKLTSRHNHGSQDE